MIRNWLDICCSLSIMIVIRMFKHSINMILVTKRILNFIAFNSNMDHYRCWFFKVPSLSPAILNAVKLVWQTHLVNNTNNYSLTLLDFFISFDI